MSQASGSTTAQTDVVEPESQTNRRELKSILRWVVSGIAVLMSLFHLYTAGFGVLGDLNQRAAHLLFTFVLIFLAYAASPTSRSRLALLDVGLAVLGAVAGGY
ncbi:MAG: hypothetical protein EHM71_05580, partial [Zetaproteobacteria bacterium]